MVRCDTNEDGKLDWEELDCAMPLILEGGLETVSSALLDLDPGTHDGARLLLSFLKMKGVPLTLAKLIAVNGSLHEFHLGEQFHDLKQWVDDGLEVTWRDLARFTGGPASGTSQRYWEIEASRRYGQCDFAPHDGKLRGKAELDCFTDVVLKQVETSLSELLMKGVTKDGLDLFHEAQSSEALRLGVKLATQSEASLRLALKGLSLSASPRSILNLLEEIIRRSVPLWQTPP
jgi:hypothetical protein